MTMTVVQLTYINWERSWAQLQIGREYV